MALSFVPRTVFPTLQNLPRSYYLGHHAKGLQQMKGMLNQVDLIIECRDYRVPLTSRNPLFEETLAGRPRVVVYTKRDLGVDDPSSDLAKKQEKLIRKWHAPDPCIFISNQVKADVHSVLRHVKNFTSKASASSSLMTGSRMMVVGMPNIGKSTLLNALRNVSLGKGKAAKTGDQPGVTRSVSSNVKIIDAPKDGIGGAVYMLDTPGVFVPYVPDGEAMLKLSLCGSVKDSVIPYGTLADYCLYRINQNDSTVYAQYCAPTNNVLDLLEAIAKGTGRLQKGGDSDLEASALWFVQQWRSGKLGKFLLDEVNEEAFTKAKEAEQGKAVSFSQAMRKVKMYRKEQVVAVR